MALRILVFTFLISFILTSCKSDASSSKDDAPIELPPEEEDYKEAAYKWGYINKGGRVVIKAEYDDCRNFSEGLAVVRKKGKWGLYRQKGTSHSKTRTQSSLVN